MDTLSERKVAAILLIACFIVFAIGGILFTGRTIWKWPGAQTGEFLQWERGVVIVALLINVMGIVLLENLVQTAGHSIISRLALVVYLIGAVVIVVAETAFLSNREWATAQVVFHVVVTFFAQAVFGAALLRSGVVPAWAGWVTIVWNLAWLLVLIVFSPRDIYYPALHHIAPLIIGIALLIR